MAHTAGVGDSIWRSDVGLLNRSTQTNAVRLRYYHGWEVLERELELAPGESRVIPDAVDWFGSSGSGPLQVFSSEALTIDLEDLQPVVGRILRTVPRRCHRHRWSRVR